MLSLGIAKQNKNAGGNNVCDPGPKNPCVPANTEIDNLMTVGKNFGPSGDFIGYSLVSSSLPQGLGNLSPPSFFPTFPLNTPVVFMGWIPSLGTPAFTIEVDYSIVPGGVPAGTQNIFQRISFINCDDTSIRTYRTSQSIFSGTGTAIAEWQWQVSPTTDAFQYAQDNAFWNNAAGKNIIVDYDSPTGLAEDYCCTNNDCDCRGPLAQCPCRKGGC